MAERRITQHAIRRFIERVDRSATPGDALRRIAEMATNGRVRPKPRSWTNCRPGPGTVFIYSAREADTCLVATRDAVLTVVSRDLCAAGREQQVARGRDQRRGRPRSAFHARREAALEAAA